MGVRVGDNIDRWGKEHKRAQIEGRSRYYYKVRVGDGYVSVGPPVICQPALLVLTI